jgi:hypothetical protein
VGGKDTLESSRFEVEGMESLRLVLNLHREQSGEIVGWGEVDVAAVVNINLRGNESIVRAARCPP